jgi:protein-arginine kinase activator protein McsA
MVLLSFLVIKQYYHGNYNRMAINYHCKKFYVIGPCFQTYTKTIYQGILTCDQCYKTFYHGNLLQFHGIVVIFSYKAILPWQLP